jgi:hypothetical protein
MLDSVLDMGVEWTRDTALDLDAEEGMLQGMNVSGVKTTPWNEFVVLVRSVRPST